MDIARTLHAMQHPTGGKNNILRLYKRKQHTFKKNRIHRKTKKGIYFTRLTTSTRRRNMRTRENPHRVTRKK